MEKYFVFMVCGVLALIFMLGAWVGKNTTESEMYHRDYRICVAELPRSKDCEANYIIFKVVDSE